jgi:endonuclease/exonuclease/phosphatase family metal-dependent hydrolase
MGEQAGLTVVTWNAQGSRGLDIALAADALAAFAPDIVLLQEIQRRQLGALRVALATVDARWRFKHWPVRVPAEGLGLLARHPVGRARIQVLARPWRFWDWRRRIAMHATLRIGGDTVRVTDVHLGAGVSTEERARQARALVDGAHGATIIAGDLNAEPGAPDLGPFRDAGWTDAEARTRADGAPPPATNWPPGPRTAAPTQRLDYVLVRDSTTVLDAFVPDDWSRWAVLSDHLPVVARLAPSLSSGAGGSVRKWSR